MGKKRIKWEKLFYWIRKPPIKRQQSRQGNTGRGIDTQINETRQRTYENTHEYDQLIFYKCAKNNSIEEVQLFNKLCWNNWTFTCAKVNSNLNLTPNAKINSVLIMDVNAKCKILKLLEKKKKENLQRLGLVSDFKTSNHSTMRQKKETNQILSKLSTFAL